MYVTVIESGSEKTGPLGLNQVHIVHMENCGVDFFVKFTTLVPVFAFNHTRIEFIE